MTTTLMGYEELAVALELTIGKANAMGVVIPVESDIKGIEVKPVAFLCVALGFLDLPDHPIVHPAVSLRG
jgi:hypothetical protein